MNRYDSDDILRGLRVLREIGRRDREGETTDPPTPARRARTAYRLTASGRHPTGGRRPTVTPTAQRIWDCLRQREAPMTVDAIAAALGYKPQTITNGLSVLRRQHLVESVSINPRGEP